MSEATVIAITVQQMLRGKLESFYLLHIEVCSF